MSAAVSPLHAAANLAKDLAAPRLLALADYLETMAGLNLEAAPVMRKQMRAEGERLRSEAAGALADLAVAIPLSVPVLPPYGLAMRDLIIHGEAVAHPSALRRWASAWVSWADAVDPE